MIWVLIFVLCVLLYIVKFKIHNWPPIPRTLCLTWLVGVLVLISLVIYKHFN